MIYWFSGNTGSGKTTLAMLLLAGIPGIVHLLDGDVLRKELRNTDMTMAGRLVFNKLVARKAKRLAEHGRSVVVSVIAPTPEIRDAIREIVPSVRFVYLPGGSTDHKVSPYSIPKGKEWWDV